MFETACRVALLVALLSAPHLAAADASERVDALLQSDSAPAGVVFEIAGGDGDTLSTLLPRVRDLAMRLRARHPDLEIAVVTHGVEQFALLTEAREEQARAHATVRSLTEDQDIPVHVCGTHASWRDHTPEDFPDYVDVSPAGPAQINDYAALGFTVIRVR